MFKQCLMVRCTDLTPGPLQTRDTLMKALSEDPTVFEYDTVYDEMQECRKQTHLKTHTKESREVCQSQWLISLTTGTVAVMCVPTYSILQPRYIGALMKAAEERKREQDIMFERKVQKERELEGDMFADKEAFMTSAYKREMIARVEMEQRLRREAEKEGECHCSANQ